MKTIWKAVLEIADEQVISMPQGSRIICSREQLDQPCIWFGCDPTNTPEKRVIFMRGTGHLLPKIGTYIGTCILHGGQLVYHIFDMGAAP